jgi:hypothetical protein
VRCHADFCSNQVDEDCLTLDAMVPKSVWDDKNKNIIEGKDQQVNASMYSFQWLIHES